MYCGSCMKDNTLVAALGRLGHDALLLPTYTPIRTDEDDVSLGQVFMGGVNVYLQQKSWLFRHTPRFVDRIFDLRGLLNWASRFAVRTKTENLGGLTISMLQGSQGRQRKEMQKLATWLAVEYQPHVVILSNVLISGLASAIKEQWNVPVLATLQGDDIFLEGLAPTDRARSIELIRANAESIDGYFATSDYYSDFMAEYLSLPRERIHVVRPGIQLKGHGGSRQFAEKRPLTIGYFARICPEKGLHNLVGAFRDLRQGPDAVDCRLRIGGWLGDNNRPYFDEQMRVLRDAGLGDEGQYIDCPRHEDKVRFLQSLDVFSVPTTYREPKGIYILEALANGVPVVQPRHGAFPELIEATGGGILVEPDRMQSLADGLRQLLNDATLRRSLGEAGQKQVFTQFSAERMAAETAAVLAQYHQQSRFKPNGTIEAAAS